MSEFDYIIVGAGSAGCVIADKLTADGRHRVLVLEAGGNDRKFWIKTPIGYGKTFHDPAVNWRFNSEPTDGLDGRTTHWPRGKVIGGSSSINAMCYIRGHKTDYDDWAAAGNPGWGWDDLEPLYRSFERRIDRDGTVRGNGPLWVSDREPEYHPVKRFFYGAAKELGLPVDRDIAADKPDSIAPYHINTRGGLRCSAADAFLRPAMRRPNLSVKTDVLVERVVFEGKRAIGVDYIEDGVSKRATARAEVILSAGAVNSPKLLKLSGIGPAAELNAMGIPVVHANEGVGSHLQDHLGISYFFRATEPTMNSVLGTWPGRIAAGLRFLLTRKGALSLSVNQIGGLVRTDPSLNRPNIQLYFNPMSYSTTYAGKRPLLKPDRWPGFIIGFNSCRPTSLGRIELAGTDPHLAPRIQPNYLTSNRDVEDIVAGARLIGRIQETASMRKLISGDPVFDVTKATDDEIVADFKKRSGSIYHPCGTCRMAPEDDQGVVDPTLRVYGVEGLRVADASIFPNITSANTNAPSILVGHKAAQILTSGN